MRLFQRLRENTLAVLLHDRTIEDMEQPENRHEYEFFTFQCDRPLEGDNQNQENREMYVFNDGMEMQ